MPNIVKKQFWKLHSLRIYSVDEAANTNSPLCPYYSRQKQSILGYEGKYATVIQTKSSSEETYLVWGLKV